jgi:hypothetical protein
VVGDRDLNRLPGRLQFGHPPAEERTVHGGAEPEEPTAPPSLPPRHLATVVSVALTGALVVAAGFLWPDGTSAGGSAAPAPSSPPDAAEPADRPTAGTGDQGVPLGAPLPAPAGGGPHEFIYLQTDDITPVGYDPCRPIHYVVRPGRAPDEGAEVLARAVQRVSEVTGLQFVDDGGTEEPAVAAGSADRPSFQPELYGDRWAPVLISWDDVEDNPGLEGDIVGQAGSSWRALGNGPRVYVSGTVSLDAEQLEDILQRRDGEAIAVAIVAHELAHLVGLAHVEDPTQLMYPEAQPAVTDFGDGDLTGLARLGSGECVPEL